jgi:hypothetical protein
MISSANNVGFDVLFITAGTSLIYKKRAMVQELILEELPVYIIPNLRTNYKMICPLSKFGICF